MALRTSPTTSIAAAALLGSIATAVTPAAAHHGGAVEWQEAVAGPLTGTATEFAFRFPHVVVFIDVDGENGLERWAISTRWTPTILREHGWTRSSIEPGDTVTVTYLPHVTNAVVGMMQTIEVNGEPLPLDF
jgi:hypothetical protein